MNINIRTKKNFQTQFNKMAETYGEEFLKLQGLDDEKLSLTDFIEGFISKNNKEFKSKLKLESDGKISFIFN